MNDAVVLLQMGELAVTVAVSSVLIVMVEVPVTGLLHVPSVTDTNETVCVVVVDGMSNTAVPEAFSTMVAGVPFKV